MELSRRVPGVLNDFARQESCRRRNRLVREGARFFDVLVLEKLCEVTRRAAVTRVDFFPGPHVILSTLPPRKSKARTACSACASTPDVWCVYYAVAISCKAA